MSFRVFLISCLICVGPAVAHAEDAPPVTGLRGTGAAGCAEFSSFYHAEPTLAETQYFSWAQGFMSGLNMNTAMGYRDLSSLSDEEQQRAILDYCDAHPSSAYKTAVYEMYRTLKLIRPPSYQ